MGKEIFISYRRGDSAGTAGRIYDRFVASFPNKNVFMDVDAEMHGLDFAKVLADRISACDLVVVIIGPDWISARDAQGSRRIDSADDFVRIEVVAALKRDIPVLPVLVDGARMPTEQDLPEDLKPLVRRHAIELRNTRFADDVAKLVDVVRQRLGAKRRRFARVAVAAALVAALAGGLYVERQVGVLPGLFAELGGGSSTTSSVATEKPTSDKKSETQVAREQEAERFRERIRKLEHEAEVRKLRRDQEARERELREQELREQREEEQKRAEQNVPPWARNWSSLPLCKKLWRTRNALFHEQGYCFTKPRGQSVFGNAGCYRNMDDAWRAMTSANQQMVKNLRKQERSNGC